MCNTVKYLKSTGVSNLRCQKIQQNEPTAKGVKIQCSWKHLEGDSSPRTDPLMRKRTGVGVEVKNALNLQSCTIPSARGYQKAPYSIARKNKTAHSHFTGLADKSLGLAKKFFWVYKTIRKNWNDLFGQPNT